MFAQVLVLVVNFFLLASASTNVAPRINFSKTALAQGIFKNSKLTFKPALRSAPVTSTSSPGTFMVNQYEAGQCAGNANIVSGAPFGVCMTGYTSEGTVVGSGIYTYLKEDAKFTYTTYSEFSTGDCTGAITLSQDNNYPKWCLAEDEQGTSARFSFIEGTDLSGHLKNGLLFSYFDEKNDCTSSAPSTQWTWLAFNHCLPTDDGKAFMAVACGTSEGKYTAATFSDPACTTPEFKGDVPLTTCEAYPEGSANDSGFRYNLYYSQSCL
jgi:hypothetical protein